MHAYACACPCSHMRMYIGTPHKALRRQVSHVHMDSTDSMCTVPPTEPSAGPRANLDPAGSGRAAAAPARPLAPEGCDHMGACRCNFPFSAMCQITSTAWPSHGHSMGIVFRYDVMT